MRIKFWLTLRCVAKRGFYATILQGKLRVQIWRILFFCDEKKSKMLHPKRAVTRMKVALLKMSIRTTERNLILHVISKRIYLLTLLSWLVRRLSTLTYYTTQRAKNPISSYSERVTVPQLPSSLSITLPCTPDITPALSGFPFKINFPCF